MNIDELLKQLPDHWEMWAADECNHIWIDDGRDYDKPIFLRKDKSARIYFNVDPTIFSITFDYHHDGQAYETFEESLKFADWYVENYPLEYHVCQSCGDKADWYYTPASSSFLIDKFYCGKHVPRGCSCNIDPDGTEALENVNGILKELPCCEYEYNEFGFPKEE
jgi:hypothetical protein